MDHKMIARIPRISFFWLIYIILVGFIANSALCQDYVVPDTRYSNENNSPVYLILSLEPDQSFANTTVDTFIVLLPNDFIDYSAQIRIDYKTDLIRARISEKKSHLESLNAQLRQTKHQNETE